MNLGENIYHLRSEKNMSQGDLADALEVSRQSVSKWENNSAVPELEKLKRMSQLFGVTLDELVGNEAIPTPPPQPTVPYVQEKRSMPGYKIAGIILLCCSFVTFVAFTIVGYLTGVPLLGLLLAIPFVLNGTVCMLCKKNTGFFCCWINYIQLFFVNFFFTILSVAGTFNPTIIASFVLLAALVAWSLYKLHKGHWGESRTKKIVWTVILSILLSFHLWLTLNSIFSNVNITYDEENYSYIQEIKEAYASTEDSPME